MDDKQETRYQSILARAEEASAHPAADDQNHDALYWQLHHLAEEHYEPAIPFFERCLHNIDSTWREEGLQLLGFHYLDYLEGNDALFERIRYLLTNDPDSYVRISAAALLLYAKESADFPDWALLQAVADDPVDQVRQAAFRSLLSHTEIPYDVILDTMRRIDHEELNPTTPLLKQLIEEHGLDLPTEELAVPLRVRQGTPPSTEGR